MTTAILVVWTIGLLGAVPATAVIVKESLLVIRTLQDTLRMARRTAAAARGVEVNVADTSSLAGIGDALRPVDASLGIAATSLEHLAQRLSTVLR